MSVVEAGRSGAVYDRGYRPYDGPRGRRGAATFALYKASMRRALGIRRSWRQKVAPFTLLGIVTIPAIVNVGIGYVTRDRFLSRTDRDHHLPRLRRRVGRAVAVRRAGRARRHVPGSPPTRAAADVRPADHRRRLRRRQARRDRDDPLRVLVPAPGRAVRRQHARERQRARLLHRPSRRALEGAGRGRAAGRVLRRRRRRDLVAHRPPHRRGRVGHRPLPRHVDRVGASSSATSSCNGGSAAALINVLALPLYLRDLVFLGHVDRRVAAHRRDQRRAARDHHLRRGVGRPASACSCAATAGWNDDCARPEHADDPAFVDDATVTVDERVGVVPAEGRAVGAQLLVRAGRHRPARTQRRGQDHAHARDHRPRRRQPGRGAHRGQRPASRSRGVPPARAGAGGRSGAGRAHRAPVRALRRRSPRRRRPERARRRAAIGRDARRRRPERRRRSARACASARRSRPRSCAIRTCSCSTNR